MFSWPQSEKDWSRYRLSDEQVLFFKRNGYLSNVKLLEHWQVDQLCEELNEIMDPDFTHATPYNLDSTG